MTTYLIFIIIAVIIQMILEANGVYIPRRSRLGFYNRPRHNDSLHRRTAPFSDWLRKTLRRRKALKRVRKFLIKKGKTLILKNKYVMVNYNTEKRNIICIDANNMKNSVTVEASDYNMRGIYYKDGELFEKIDLFFDVICNSFDTTSNYAGVSALIKEKFTYKEKIAEPTKKQKPQQPKQQPKQSSKNIEKINVNEATEEQLADLPGISIVQAKKTIERINRKGDFRSIEEFFIEIKVKPHFQAKLRKMILTASHRVSERNKDGDDRIIDL